jgi:hypothetical protein
MADAKIRTEIVDGASFDIFVRKDGQFYANVPGDDPVSAPSLELVVKKLRAFRRKAAVRVAIPAIYLSNRRPYQYDALADAECTRVTITGIHARTKSILCRDEKGEAFTGDRDDFLKPDTNVKKFTELRDALNAAGKAFYQFKKSHKFDPTAALAEAYKKAGMTIEEDE